MTKKMLRTKKAISPILATLLLVVIAVAAIVVTYAWVMTFMTHTTNQASSMLREANTYYYNQSSTKMIDVDVLNSGTSDTQIIQVYVGTSSSNLQNQTVAQTLPLPLPAGQKQTITITYNWNNGVTYDFKVLSSSGQYVEWSQQAPSA